MRPVRPPAPKLPSPTNAELHQTRNEWFISQYSGTFNPNEDTPLNWNCGPTSITMIAKAFGRLSTSAKDADAAIEESRRRMQADPSEMKGTHTYQLVYGAWSYGLKAKRVRTESIDAIKRELAKNHLVIAQVIPTYLNPVAVNGHYTVVTAIENGKVYLNDPAEVKGPIAVSEQAFMEALRKRGTFDSVSIGVGRR